MDIETLTNHVAGMGKIYFDNACKIVLKDVFGLNAINVDGKSDGGTDFSSFLSSGERLNVGYQITTQKTDIQNKAYRDAKKAIEKLGVQRYYFFATYNLTEIETRIIENDISSALGIQAVCLSPRNIAGLILESGLLNRLLDESNYPLPRDYTPSYDYKEMALHSYTLLSDDAMKMKNNIYDDTILFVLSGKERYNEDSLVVKVKEFLGLNDAKLDAIKRRIGALFGKSKLVRSTDGCVELHPSSQKELQLRKDVYSVELASISSSQVDLMVNDFDCAWTEDDSKKVALWIANISVYDQLNALKEAKASIVSNPLFQIAQNGEDKLRDFLVKEKKIKYKDVSKVVEKLLDNASNHPLINKIARASIYLALEGSNPISSAKALGANRWSDFKILVEPTIAIPYICSSLYKGSVNRYFDLSIKSLGQALELGVGLYIPYFYISECAGHLLRARKYNGLEFSEDELAYSSNAFVANYFALKSKGAKVPNSFMDYLSSFSANIITERSDIKSWVRAIMIDIQSILGRSKVQFIDVPFYNPGDCKDFEMEYTYHLSELGIDKKHNLISHDIYALQFVNDRIINNHEHWIVLTYDTAMISVSKSKLFQGWIANPIKFLDFAEVTKPLGEARLISLVHSFATFSEKTLAVGARIIDRVIAYAAPEMQNWEFKRDIDIFKTEVIESINLEKIERFEEIDIKTDEFLKKHGIKVVKEESELMDD
ncbi:hypothetical protein LGH70_06955 [Hymenobacter sp. BT635]|uniref:Restriction endonuclease n=1 Tax=Hymenobacter nitidus TaxID=2880929 RepID=A0ABS8ADM3_9BACT|nr:hypothetical protein [Hymenobacter nitidus]MCB2377315.1 hypothetical protein [Hymenobacter nitidus]